MRQCRWCSKDISHKGASALHCNRRCKRGFSVSKRPRTPQTGPECRQCGAVIANKAPYQAYCSTSCKSKWHHTDPRGSYYVPPVPPEVKAARLAKKCPLLHPKPAKDVTFLTCVTCSAFTIRPVYCSGQCSRAAERKTAGYRLTQKRRRSERRALLAAARVDGLTNKDLATKVNAQGGQCHWGPHPHGENYHLDHVMPIALGGGHNLDNLVASCPSCNQAKSAMHPEDWVALLG